MVRRGAVLGLAAAIWSVVLPVAAEVVGTAPVVQAATTATATYIRTIKTYQYSPPAPDPAGIAYIPSSDKLIISDSEVEEMSIWAGSNLFVARRDGTQLDKGSTYSYSKESTGLGYNAADGTLFVSDDDADKIFQVKAGSDGRFGTGDDFDGVGTEVWVLTKGSNGKFDGPSPAGDDGLTHFDMGAFGATDIEGIGHNSTTGNLLLADRGTKKVFEVTPTGGLLQTITLGGTAVKKPSDITPAPASSGSGALSIYVSDRAVDNDNTPSENDGMVHELTYPGSGGVANTQPTVNAGPDLAVTQPNAATLNGSVTDDGLPSPPGTTTKSWTKTSGPGTVNFTAPTQPVTNATFSQTGTYVLRLTASDSQLSNFDETTVVVSAANTKPTVNAGPDLSVTQPNAATLNGSVTDDGLPNPPAATTKSWTKTSGPGTVSFTAPSQSVTDATFSQAGTYVLRLTASDSQLSNFDEATVVVAAGNTKPTVNAGSDLAVTQPDAATLNGSVTDDGLPAPPASTTKSWTKESGPGTVTFGDASLAATTATFSSSGTYVLRLTASDSALSNFDETTVVVSPPVNHAPSVYAGPDQSVTYPTPANLSATITDDGLPDPPAALTITWAQQSGPGTVVFGDASQASTTATFSAPGTYVLGVTAYDGQYSTFDELTVEAPRAANTKPTVDAGPDVTVKLPAAATLNGSITDDGLPLVPGSTSASWGIVSGPGAVTFTAPTSAVTDASFSAAGTYVLRLTGSDGELSASDQVTVVVQPNVASFTIDVPIRTSTDDAEQRGGGNMDITSTDLELVVDGSVNQQVGLRFSGLNIPHGAQITNAYVQFVVDEVSTDTANLTIKAQAAGDALPFLATLFDVSSRTQTTESVAWTPPTWPTVGAAGTAQRTPDVKVLIQKVTDRADWATGHALVLIITGTGRRTAEAFEGTAVAVLHVEFQA